MHDKKISPVGWYVCSYLLRFIELDARNNDDAEAKFLSWENTILVKAATFDEAYDKTIVYAAKETEPYKGGSNGIDVQWVFEGVTEVLAIHEELQDGSEIMWCERTPRKLKNLRALVRTKQELAQ